MVQLTLNIWHFCHTTSGYRYNLLCQIMITRPNDSKNLVLPMKGNKNNLRQITTKRLKVFKSNFQIFLIYAEVVTLIFVRLLNTRCFDISKIYRKLLLEKKFPGSVFKVKFYCFSKKNF